MWNLFLDDERHPPDNGRDFTLARSSHEAIACVEERGMPEFISFDHDLGGDDTAMVFLTWLENMLLEDRLRLSETFSYTVHSQNPIGARNISGRLEPLLQHLRAASPAP